MAKDPKKRGGEQADPEAGARRPQPKYWIRLAIFIVPLVLSELMFLRIGRTWNLVIFPIVWLGYWYFQMLRGGWNVFDPNAK